MNNDTELLRRYARKRDEGAFAELVKRYVDLVYTAAVRQVQDVHVAEDVTQKVFLNLATRASALPEDVVLPGWLCADTRLTALETLRKERRRTARETAAMNESKATEDWSEIRPVIDETLAELSDADRDAVVLRFFGDRSFAEIGASLRLAPDAARMRVNRALEKLRGGLEKRGIKTTAAALSAALLVHAVRAAPPGVGARVMASLNGVKGGSAVATFAGKGALTTGAIALAAAFVLMAYWPRSQETPPAAPMGAIAFAEGETAPTAPTAERLEDETIAGIRNLKLKVIEGSTSTPLAGVEVKFRAFTDVLRSTSQTLYTDENGTLELTLPTEHLHDFHHQLHLSLDGYVPRYVSWSTWQHDDIQDIPAEYTARMDRGVQIGGYVRDPSGMPIAGAKLVFSAPGIVGVPPRERDTTMGYYHTETSDSAGMWRCSHVRSDFRSITFLVEHERHQTVTYGCRETTEQTIGPILLPQDDFLALHADFRMQPGLTVRGVVLDETGRPFGGARVARDRDWRKEAAHMTGSGGEFSFQNVSPGNVILTVEAQGYAPQTKTVEVENGEAKTEFKLNRSLGFRGTVVDENGVPLEKAEVSMGKDGRYRRLYNWSATTDALGSFYWDSSPNEPFEIDVFNYGFRSETVLAKPGNDVQVITLTRDPDRQRVEITIVAVDGRTKAPLTNATLHVEQWRESSVAPFHEPRPSATGVFKFTATDGSASYQFEVRAPGHLPARTPSMRVTEPKTVHLELPSGEAISGRIIGPDGEPVANAEVALCTGEKGALLSNRQLVYVDQSIVVRSDASGRFQHETQLGAHTIYAVHRSGFAKVRLNGWETGGEIRLQPWGRIVGVVVISGEVLKNARLGLMVPMMNGDERDLTLHNFDATTDDQGRFVFEDVPPLEVRLSWMVPTGPTGTRYSHAMPVEVAPDQTTEVIYRLEGPTVRGRLKFDGEVDWPAQGRWANFRVKMEPPSYGSFRGADEEARRKAFSEFWQSDEGREWSRKNRSFGFAVQADGSFEIAAVPPGEYELRVMIRESPARPTPPMLPGKLIAELRKDVVVPEGETELNLGEIEVPRGR